MKLKKRIAKYPFFRRILTKFYIEDISYPGHFLTKDKIGPIIIPHEGDVIASCFKKYGSWQGGISQLIIDLCTPSSKILEIGSNYGLHAREIAHYCNEIHCIEANPSIAPYLQMNLVMCGAGNTNMYNICASNKSGEVIFLDRSNTSNSGYSRIIQEGDDLSEGKQIKLSSKPLDQIFQDIDFDIIKIDIEGHELEALQGAKETLSKVQFVIIETNHLEQLQVNVLEDFNFFKIELLPEHLENGYILHPIDAPLRTSEFLAVRKK
ncbi:FkbM family methyltransferase [Terasakiella pusilla]|uniref:FkbM family methyltransferase n=1 Tax=Terasakiella pusilla TaxID=64973 RepID=UPI00048C14EF|nr:FkbM family methyltransferase [Terasakiella pusilla]